MTRSRTPERMVIDRRTFLAVAAASVGGILLSSCSPMQPSSEEAAVTFVQAGAGGTLTVPPLLEGRVRNGVRTFDLVAQAGRVQLSSEGAANTWGFNGPFLGPTIRAARGEQVRLRVRNELPDVTTVHWHGMHLPAVADGGPHQSIAPGATWEPEWTISQPAATLWYHPHPHGATEAHVYRGLSGLFIIDDDEEASLDLPREYGVDDLPLIIQDKEFDDAGQLVETERRGPGMLGSTILVNGIAAPSLDLSSQATRFRILNGSTARSYNLGFSDDRPFDIIASDGGLLVAPVSVNRVLVTPGERVEIVVRFDAGESAALRSFPQDLGDVAGTTGADDELDILRISAAANITASSATPAALAAFDRLDAGVAAEARRFEMGTDRINDELMDIGRIDEVVTVDALQIWEVANMTRTPHNFHVHGTQFQIAAINGAPPAPEAAGWKDTVYLPPQVPIQLVMRFTDYTDPNLPYMYHCHLLWHEDIGMMGQFVVVEPGEQAGTIDTGGHAH